jgi:GntR family transcriptional regulator
MHIQVNYKSGKPVYWQIVEQVKEAAASAAIRPGETLPSIRPLAEQLRVNRNTVAKAYEELERQGVIETVAGKGCFLSQGISPLKKKVRYQILAQHIDEAIVHAHHLQVNPEDFLQLVQERLEYFARQIADGVANAQE